MNECVNLGAVDRTARNMNTVTKLVEMARTV
jgi:hypothetical protein